jgi:prevent-host-death family protein
MRTVIGAEASRRFSQLLHRVGEGRSYVVTHHGRPVARIVPARPQDRPRAGARAILLARLCAQPAIDVGRWTREELHFGDSGGGTYPSFDLDRAIPIPEAE